MKNKNSYNLFYDFVMMAVVFNISVTSLVYAGEPPRMTRLSELHNYLLETKPSSLAILLGPQAGEFPSIFSDNALEFAMQRVSPKAPVFIFDAQGKMPKNIDPLPADGSELLQGFSGFLYRNRKGALQGRPLVLLNQLGTAQTPADSIVKKALSMGMVQGWGAADRLRSSVEQSLAGLHTVSVDLPSRSAAGLAGSLPEVSEVHITLFDSKEGSLREVLEVLSYLKNFGPQHLRIDLRLITSNEFRLKNSETFPSIVNRLSMTLSQYRQKFPDLFNPMVSASVLDTSSGELVFLIAHTQHENKKLLEHVEGLKEMYRRRQVELTPEEMTEIVENNITTITDFMQGELRSLAVNEQLELATEAEPELQRLAGKGRRSLLIDLLSEEMDPVEIVDAAIAADESTEITPDSLKEMVYKVRNLEWAVRQAGISTEIRAVSVRNAMRARARALLRGKL